MIYNNKQVLEVLLDKNYISQEDYDKTIIFAKKNNEDVLNYLFTENIINEDLLGQAMGEYYQVPFINLKKQKVDESVLLQVPELVAKNRHVIAFAQDKKGIKLGMVNPEDIEIRQAIEKRFGHPIYPYFITLSGWQEVISYYEQGVSDDFLQTLSYLEDPSLDKMDKDRALVKGVEQLFVYAYYSKASDIHIEPYEDKILVRFRIDGIMHDVFDLPSNVFDLILTRIKIMSKIRIDEHRSAQDGKLRFDFEDEKVDVRVSIVPTSFGENIVMRLLSDKSRRYNLAEVGLSSSDLTKLNKYIKNPHGMILSTGPTGSGKTTTLYALLKILNKREVNITTIEDPIEYNMTGITQIQVDEKSGLTFSKGLRSLVRQDPDIIMVGEIRDEETASIAINSALTGHLVLSTLHTNDAATTLSRLVDMGIEPFLIASTINIAIAQRLVRRICPNCRVSYKIEEKEKKIIKKCLSDSKLKSKISQNINKINLYKGEGCKFCNNTGYSGRIGIFEILEMSEKIKELILSQSSSDQISHQAELEGMTTMVEDGINKVLNGITTIYEITRVTQD